jgi:hypothetical protein
MNQPLKKCDNPECNRRTTAMYCCGSCNQAHQNHYEIHESGVLGHSEGCDERHRERCKNPNVSGPLFDRNLRFKI